MSSFRLTDSPAAYGPLSKLLHWSMALLFLWQLTSVLLRALFWEQGGALQEAARAMWRTHHQVGVLILALALLRGTWGLINARNRPPHEKSLLGLAAWLGHLALYALMILVPLIAVARFYAMARAPLNAFGLQILPQGPALNEPVRDFGDLLHGPLGWTLFALIFGHILMVVLHQVWWRDATLSRMTSARLDPRGAARSAPEASPAGRV